MEKIYLIIFSIILCSTLNFAQNSGNRVYTTGTQKRKPQASTGILTGDSEGKGQFYYIEANVLMNLKADSFIAVFGIVQEAINSAESNAKVNGQIAALSKELEGLGVNRNDIYVDYIAQNKVYDYTASGNVVTEKFSGFETKKNIAVRYKERDLLEKILAAATKNSIFDLIEVDYVISDLSGVRAKLFDEAVKIIKRKELNYTNSFGIKMAAANVANEKYDSFYPGELYSSYQAFEAGNTYGDYNNRVVQQRKTKTFFYEPLDVSSFDSVINQIGIEPVVQFTLYLRMQYDLKK